MTPADIERMAEEAGMMDDGGCWFSVDDDQDVSTEALTRFAALVRAQALDEAAKECEQLNGYANPTDCAAAIRALAGQPSAAVEAVSNPQR